MKRLTLIVLALVALAAPCGATAAQTKTLTGQVLAVNRAVDELSVVSTSHRAASYRVRAHLPASLGVTSKVRLTLRASTATNVILLGRFTASVSFPARVLAHGRSSLTVALADDSRYSARASDTKGARTQLTGNLSVLSTGETVLITLKRQGSGTLIAVAAKRPNTSANGTNDGKPSGASKSKTPSPPADPADDTASGTITAIAVDDSSFIVRTAGGLSLTFSTGGDTSAITSFRIGDPVQVSYTESSAGTLTAQHVEYESAQSAVQATGTLATIASGDSSFTIQTNDGQSMTLSTGGDGSVIDGFVVGDRVRVTYARDSSNGVLTAHEVQYTSAQEAGQATGTVAAVAADGSSFTIQRSAAQMTVIDALTTAANNIDQGDYPYVYGGGHEQVGVPSAGIISQGNGANGINVGYDCSGAVAAVLAAGGLWPAGGSVPTDASIITELVGEGLISPGPGSGPAELTLYDDPGYHIFIAINGLFFGTSDGDAGNHSQPNDGAGWLNDGAADASNPAFQQYHVLPSRLARIITYAPSTTFSTGANKNVAASFRVGDSVHVAYTESSAGNPVAQSVTSASS